MLTGSTMKPDMERNISLCCTAMTQYSVYWLKQKHSPALPSAHSLSGKIFGTGFSVHCSSSAVVEKTLEKSMRNFSTAVLEQLSRRVFSPDLRNPALFGEVYILICHFFCGGGEAGKYRLYFVMGILTLFFSFFLSFFEKGIEEL